MSADIRRLKPSRKDTEGHVRTCWISLPSKNSWLNGMTPCNVQQNTEFKFTSRQGPFVSIRWEISTKLGTSHMTFTKLIWQLTYKFSKAASSIFFSKGVKTLFVKEKP